MKRSRTNQTLVVPPSGGAIHGLPVSRREWGTGQSRLKAELRTGFTLVEMLVAVTLVLLMLVMFGEIFQLASASVSKQRVIADNDQNVRTFVTVLRADLDKRSFRSFVPFFPEERSENYDDSVLSFQKRRGYFSISFNNAVDNTDNVLQFTADVRVKDRNSDETPFYGRAIQLLAGAGGTSALNFLNNANQPDRDDGQITANEAADSKAAEICYVMRGRKLYRRVMLLREPDEVDPANPAQPSFRDPATGNRIDYFLPGGVYDTQSTGSLGSIGFWRDFDFSASRTPTSLGVFAAGQPINARFHGINEKQDWLSNTQTTLLYPPHPLIPSLGQTWNRFGHNHEITLGPPIGPVTLNNGLPREFTAATSTTVPVAFLGRLTQEETSHMNFRYPQAMALPPASPPGAWNGNPMDATGTELTLDPETGAVNEFEGTTGAPRLGVDLLLAHVHEFRIEIWDERIGDFVTPGHSLFDASGVEGDYHISRQQNPTYVPLGGAANVIDSWHPQFNRNANFTAGATPQPILSDVADQPPYRPLKYAPAGTGSGTIPAGPLPPGPTTYWTPSTNYVIGSVVFPRTEDLNANGVLDPGEDGSAGFPPTIPPALPTADSSNPIPNPFAPSLALTKFAPFGLTYCYRCIKLGTSGSVVGYEPSWTKNPGQIVRGNPADIDNSTPPNGNVTDPGDVDYNGNGIQDLAEPDWICEYNVRPLRAIRVTVRFEHPTSKQMRQITIVHSLRDTTSTP